MNEELQQHRHPAPMPPVEPSVILFVTIGTLPRVSAFANRAFQYAFVLACGDADAWFVGRYMIMPDHVHLFCTPASRPSVDIQRWSGYLKRRITARLMESQEGGSRGRSPSTRAPDPGWKWQSDCWDMQIRGGEHYREKWEYVRLNPVRRGLVESADDWPWQGELNVLSS